MDKDTSNMAIAGLAFMVILFGWLWWGETREVRDYRTALDEANTVIDDTSAQIYDAQSSSDGADFDELHSIIDGLNAPDTVLDPHPSE